MRLNPISSILLSLAILATTGANAGGITENRSGKSFPFKTRKISDLQSVSMKTVPPSAAKFYSPKAIQANGTVLYGDVVYADNWTSSSSPYGVYSFPVASVITPESVYEDYNFKSNAGAVFQNGMYNILNANISSENVLESISYYQYDADSWEENDENEFSNPCFIATDMTVDPISNTVYGAFSDGNGGLQLATFNFTSSGYEVKGKLSKQILAIAADAEGMLFGIGEDGILYKVDKESAQLTKIGATGIIPSTYVQSATFDWLSGKLYWATTLTNDVAGLYEVDVNTGKATLISNFPYNEEVIGLYCTNKLSEGNAPAAVENLNASFSGISTTGTISFTMPSTTNDGDEISGELSYTVKVNGETVREGNAAAGAEVSLADVTVSAGSTKILVYACNDNGKGMPAYTMVWTGYDVPKAPLDATVSYNAGEASIEWSATDGGVHNGFVDSENITYTVTRKPDNVVVADGIKSTEYKDNFIPAQLAVYYYTVTATSNGQTSDESKTNTFVAGDAVVPPYSQQFDDASTFGLMTVIDGNGDGAIWNMSADNSCAEIQYADYGSDDWLITPQIKLTNDRLWKFSCRINTPWAPNWNEKIRVSYGKSALAAGMTDEILKDTIFKTADIHLIEKYFTVGENANYNIGIHAGSYELYQIQADSIMVEAGPYYTAPASAGEMKAVAAAAGGLSATVTFVAPEKTVAGTPLTSLTKIELYRNGELIKTFQNPEPGEAVSYVDNESVNGFNTYKTVGYNSVGFGLDANARVYVGEDLPAAPENVKVVADNGKGTITWQAPTKGVNDGYINTQDLYYGIKDYDNNVLATAAKGTSFTVDVDEQGQQGYMMYAVFAGNSKGYSEAGQSNVIIKGAPYALPFYESFDDGQRENFWGSVPFDNSWASWNIKGGEGVGGKSGQATLIGGQTGNEARLFSGKIDLGKSENPVLEFYYWYRAEEGNQPLEVQVISEGKDTTTVKQLEYTRYMYAKDYELIRVPLSQFKGKKYIQVAFYCKSGDPNTAASVDEISVRDFYDYDLEANISVPQTVKSADSLEIIANVENIGGNAASGYTVNLYEDNQLVASQPGEDIATDETKTYTFKQTAGTLKKKLNYKVVVDYAADGNTANNESPTASVSVALPEYPAPSDLAATEEADGVSLSWTAADYQDFTLTTTDGAEDYAAFADGTIGEWTTVDKDGLNTRSDITVDSYPVEFPQQGQKMSFMVMNPEQAKAQLVNWMDEPTGWQAASGKQYFASFGSEDGANDDWLISPELTGDAQTISFNIHGYYGDEYEVLYSTTDKNPDSFQSISKNTAPVVTWTKAEFELPEGAKYFAIRNTSYDYPYYIFVDDIMFKAAKDKGSLVLKGYNIYRDGKKLNDEPLMRLDYEDASPARTKHLYQVTAVYTIGESAGVDCEVDITSGIVETKVNAQNAVKTYTTSGMTVTGGAKGLVIRKSADGTVRKVVVR